VLSFSWYTSDPPKPISCCVFPEQLVCVADGEVRLATVRPAPTQRTAECRVELSPFGKLCGPAKSAGAEGIAAAHRVETNIKAPLPKALFSNAESIAGQREELLRSRIQ